MPPQSQWIKKSKSPRLLQAQVNPRTEIHGRNSRATAITIPRRFPISSCREANSKDSAVIHRRNDRSRAARALALSSEFQRKRRQTATTTPTTKFLHKSLPRPPTRSRSRNNISPAHYIWLPRALARKVSRSRAHIIKSQPRGCIIYSRGAKLARSLPTRNPR